MALADNDAASRDRANPTSISCDVCPFFGLERDPTLQTLFPHERTRCYRGQKPQSISIYHQRTHCIGADYTDCPRWQLDGDEPSIDLLLEEVKQEPDPGWVRRAAPFIMAVLLLALSVGGAYGIYVSVHMWAANNVVLAQSVAEVAEPVTLVQDVPAVSGTTAVGAVPAEEKMLAADESTISSASVPSEIQAGTNQGTIDSSLRASNAPDNIADTASAEVQSSVAVVAAEAVEASMATAVPASALALEPAALPAPQATRTQPFAPGILEYVSAAEFARTFGRPEPIVARELTPLDTATTVAEPAPEPAATNEAPASSEPATPAIDEAAADATVLPASNAVQLKDSNHLLRVSTGAANVRSGPSIAYAALGRVYNGEIITMLSQAPSGWYEIETAGGLTGWVSFSVVEPLMADPETGTRLDQVRELRIVATSTNLRFGPSTADDIVTRAFDGDIVTVIGRSSDYWYYVMTADGYFGWVAFSVVAEASFGATVDLPLLWTK